VNVLARARECALTASHVATPLFRGENAPKSRSIRGMSVAQVASNTMNLSRSLFSSSPLVGLAVFASLACAGCLVGSDPDSHRTAASTSVNQPTPVSGGDSSSSGSTSGGSSSGSGGSSGSTGNAGSGGTGTGGGGTGGSTGTNGIPAGALRVFVTQVTHNGNFGGLTGADTVCQNAADAQGLGGTWVAWLSSGTTNAHDRVTSAGPWYAIDGAKVFNNKANLETIPLAPIVDETGATPRWMGLTSPWTGSDQGGVTGDADCAGWTSASTSTWASSGTAGGYQVDQDWGGGSGTMSCDTQAPLICFEQ
jgi:hypothetical protein